MHNPFRQTPVAASPEEFDALIPVPAVDHEDDGEAVTVLEPRFRGWPVLERWLQPRLGSERAYVRVRLEERGSFIWRELDGRRTVRDLFESFQAAFPDEADDPAHRVRLFLAGMQKHGFVTLLRRA